MAFLSRINPKGTLTVDILMGVPGVCVCVSDFSERTFELESAASQERFPRISKKAELMCASRLKPARPSLVHLV